MSESGVWKAVDSSCFERLKTLIGQQIRRQNVESSVEKEAGGSNEGYGLRGSAGKDWKSCPELFEEMELRSSTYHHDLTTLRHMELMEKEMTSGPGEVTILTGIAKDLEARQTSARTKVRCRQHRLSCVLEVFEMEADSIISQLESREGTEVDFSSWQRVMRLKGMMKEAVLTAESLGSAKRESITVELIVSSCGLLRKLLSRLSERMDTQTLRMDTKSLGMDTQTLGMDTQSLGMDIHVQPLEHRTEQEERTTLNAEESEMITVDECSTFNPMDLKSEMQQEGKCVPLQRLCSAMDEEVNEETTKRSNNDLLLSEGSADDTATMESLPPPPTFAFSSSPISSSSTSSITLSVNRSKVTSHQSIVFQSSFSLFRLRFLGALLHYSHCLLSALLPFLISFYQRATSSEQRLSLRSKLCPATPKYAQRLVKSLKNIFRGKVMEEYTYKCSQVDEGHSTETSEVELAGSWMSWLAVEESVYEGKTWWCRMVRDGWLSSATTKESSLPVKSRGSSSVLIPDERSGGWMSPIVLFCIVIWSVLIVFFDWSPIVPIRMVGRMVQWILFDPVVDLRHRGLAPI